MSAKARTTVVIGWGPGEYTFRRWWHARLFEWVAQRWTGWTSWSILSEDDRARSLKPKVRKP